MLRLYLTGRMAIETDAGVVGEHALPGRQGRLALAYLAIDAQRPVTRDALAQALWDQTLPPAWDSALKALLSRLRTVLVRAGFDAGRAITSVSGCYQLHLPHDAWIDAEACARAIDAAEAALRHGEPTRAWSEATVAAAIARRPVLAGEDLPWVDDLRTSLGAARVRALECLTEVWLASGNPALAISLATESIALDPFREPPYRLLMRAHFLAGDRAQALRTYDRYAHLLATELDAPPHPETTALRDHLAGP